MRDVHRFVIDNHGELICIYAVSSLKHKVPCNPVDPLTISSVHTINEFDLSRRVYAEPPCRRPVKRSLCGFARTSARIANFVPFVRRTRDERNLLTRTIAVIRQVLTSESFDGIAVDIESLRLFVRSMNASHI